MDQIQQRPDLCSHHDSRLLHRLCILPVHPRALVGACGQDQGHLAMGQI